MAEAAARAQVEAKAAKKIETEKAADAEKASRHTVLPHIHSKALRHTVLPPKQQALRHTVLPLRSELRHSTNLYVRATTAVKLGTRRVKLVMKAWGLARAKFQFAVGGRRTSEMPNV